MPWVGDTFRSKIRRCIGLGMRRRATMPSWRPARVSRPSRAPFRTLQGRRCMAALRIDPTRLGLAPWRRSTTWSTFCHGARPKRLVRHPRPSPNGSAWTPLIGQAEAGPPPLANAHAEAPFQIAYLATDGRLARVQRDLRCSESTAFRDRHEDREHVEIGLAKTRGDGAACRHHMCQILQINMLYLIYFRTKSNLTINRLIGGSRYDQPAYRGEQLQGPRPFAVERRRTRPRLGPQFEPPLRGER